ncbi:MAG: BBP7 family outer membrane beta-barrel protein [Gemmataceae bacterium]
MHSRTLGLWAVLFVGGWAVAQTPAPVVNPALPPTPQAGYPAVPQFGAAPAGAPAVGGGTALAEAGGPVFYAGGEYLLWQIRKDSIPATASTIPVGLIAVDISDLFSFSPTGSPNFPGAGVTGYAPISIFNEATLGGGRYTNIGGQNGARFTLGFWADPDMSWGVEGVFSFLERGSDEFVATSSLQGNQFLLDTPFSRNLFVIGAGGSQTLLRTFDVFVAREAQSSLAGQANASLYNAEVNARCVGFRIGGFDWGGLVGVRYLNLNESLALQSNVRLFAPDGIPPTDADATGSISRNLLFSTTDRTRIYNHFVGAQVGVDCDFKFGPCFIYGRLKTAVGTNFQTADIRSFTSLTNLDPDPGRSPPSYTTQGGLMASPGQNGRHTRSRFAFLPEGNVKLGYQFTEWLRGTVGYDALVLVNAARPGGSVVTNQLSTTVRVAQTPDINVNLNQPTFRFRDQDVWVQGLSLGLEARY